MYYKNNSFLVVGMQKSGYYSSKLLLEKGATVYLYDTRNSELVKNNIEELTSLGAKVVEDLGNVEKICNVLVLSPGVPIDSEIVVKFKKAKKRVLGELELGSMQFTTPIIAVTGTNGKTTVSTMLERALNSANINAELVGNVGVPVTSKISEIIKSDVVVIEVSSFQLESTYAFIPHVSIVLNLSPDHLDRHYTFENYSLVKSKIVIPQKESEYSVLNYDDETVREFSSLSPSNTVWFSCKEKVNGAYIEEGNVCYMGEVVFKYNPEVIKTAYSLENILAVVATLKIMGLKNEDIESSINEFGGVKHRREVVAQINGVTYINDSKSTNPASTISAIKELDRQTLLILGGYDKGLELSELFKGIKLNEFIKCVILTGQSALNMASVASKEGVLKLSIASDFTSAVKLATTLANEGDCVLLSPATSSFDEFESYEQRGERFSEIVKST